MKKFVSLVLAAVMVMAMTVVAFADGDTSSTTKGSITITNPKEGTTYTAYKIFDVTYNNDGAYAYTMKANPKSEWYDVVNRYKGIKLTLDLNGKNYVVEKNDQFSTSEFVQLLKNNVNGKSKSAEVTANEGDTNLTFTQLDLGYYFVTTSTGAVCNLTTTNHAVDIVDKNDIPFNKTDNKDNVTIGNTVNYEIIGKVPDTTGFIGYTYEIADTMSEGLTFDATTIEITVGGTTIDPSTDDNYTLTTNQNGFTLKIDVKKLDNQKGEEIKVTYSAKVNEKAAGVVSKNKATLKYSNDPTNAGSTETLTDEENVYSAKLVIDKYDSKNKNKKLSGAKFVLKDANGKFYKYENGIVSWENNQEAATEITTNASGEAEFKGLVNGTYSLKETKAPEGYNMLTSEVSVQVNGSEKDETSLTVTSSVENHTGALLPSTGGIGTTIFYVLGGILVLGAAVVLVTKRRVSGK